MYDTQNVVFFLPLLITQTLSVCIKYVSKANTGAVCSSGDWIFNACRSIKKDAEAVFV